MENKNNSQALEEKIESGVMEKIKSGKIKLRSRYLFLAERLGLGSAFIFSLLLAILFFTFLLSYLRASDNLIYLSFGSRGLLAFLQSFPYILVSSFIIFIFIAGFIIKKSQIYYQKPFINLILFSLSFVILIGSLMSFTSIREKFENHPFSCQGFGYFSGSPEQINTRGLAGRVVGLDSQFIIIQTPQQLINLTIPLMSPEQLMALEPGQFIIAVGERRDNEFIAEQFRLINDNDMRIIRRGVMNKFGPIDSQMRDQMHQIRKCINDCLLEKVMFELCRQKCLIK